MPGRAGYRVEAHRARAGRNGEGHGVGQGRLVARRYRLTERIGSGGMGTVWRAEDEVLGRQVALKRLHAPPHLSDDELATLYERTRREARSAARITHPNVVVVHDVVDDDEGLPCIVMEYVPSTTLGDAAQGAAVPSRPRRRPGSAWAWSPRCGPRTPPACCTVTSSPAMCCSARTTGSCSPTSASRWPAGTSTLTKTGEMVGSIDYMAPERVRGPKARPGFRPVGAGRDAVPGGGGAAPVPAGHGGRDGVRHRRRPAAAAAARRAAGAADRGAAGQGARRAAVGGGDGAAAEGRGGGGADPALRAPRQDARHAAAPDLRRRDRMADPGAKRRRPSPAAPRGAERRGGGATILAVAGATVMWPDGGGRSSADAEAKPTLPPLAPPVPRGFHLVKEKNLGVSFPVPNGWKPSERTANRVTYIDPSGLVEITIGTVDPAGPTPVAHFADIEANTKMNYAVYRRLRMDRPPSGASPRRSGSTPSREGCAASAPSTSASAGRAAGNTTSTSRRPKSSGTPTVPSSTR